MAQPGESPTTRTAATDPLSCAVVRLADGDRGAFEEVYRAVAPRVDALCRRLLGSGPDAEDAAQQVLMRVFTQVEAFDPARGSAMSWVLTLAAWEARTVRQRRVRRREDPLPDTPLAACGPDPESALVVRTLDRALGDALQGLSPIDRETVLASVGMQDRPDVAAATFRKRLQRATARLRRVFGGQSD